MIRSTNEKPPSEEDTLLALQNYFHEMQSAQIEFEELWSATDNGRWMPDEEAVKQRLRIIASRAELIELAFTSLRIMREFPEWTTQRWAATEAKQKASHEQS